MNHQSSNLPVYKVLKGTPKLDAIRKSITEIKRSTVVRPDVTMHPATLEDIRFQNDASYVLVERSPVTTRAATLFGSPVIEDAWIPEDTVIVGDFKQWWNDSASDAVQAKAEKTVTFVREQDFVPDDPGPTGIASLFPAAKAWSGRITYEPSQKILHPNDYSELTDYVRSRMVAELNMKVDEAILKGIVP